jgi:hypothetical protein
VLLMDVHEITLGDFHPLFFRGSYWAYWIFRNLGDYILSEER